MNNDTKQSLVIHLQNEADTEALAIKLAQLPINGSVWLTGDLGAGKTTLTRYWLRALGHTGNVKSPTYTLVEPYVIQLKNGHKKPVYHADLYRLQDPEELEFIGFDEYLEEKNSLVIIEWASRAEDCLPEPMFTLTIQETDSDHRQVTIQLTDTGIQQGLSLSLLKND